MDSSTSSVENEIPQLQSPSTFSIGCHELQNATARPVFRQEDVETGAFPIIELPTSCETLPRKYGSTRNDRIEIDGSVEATAVVEPASGEGGIMSLEDLESPPIAKLVKQDDVESDSEATALEEHQLDRRAEFISATVYKEDETTPMGMGLVCHDGEVLISSMTPGALASKTPFRVGDRLLSINAKRCYIMDSKSVVQFMATLVGPVTIVAHNKGGDPNLVESMVTKPTADSRCGLGLKSCGRRHLKVSNIDHDGLFFDSLLNVGDPLVTINGEDCRYCDAQDAGEMIQRAGKYITIKAETLLETGVVVAAFSCNNSTGSTIPPAILAAVKKIDDSRPSTAQLVALALIAVSMVVLVMSTGFL